MQVENRKITDQVDYLTADEEEELIISQSTVTTNEENEMIDKVAKNSTTDEQKNAYLSGVGKHGESLISILDIAGLFLEKEEENA